MHILEVAGINKSHKGKILLRDINAVFEGCYCLVDRNSGYVDSDTKAWCQRIHTEAFFRITDT